MIKNLLSRIKYKKLSVLILLIFSFITYSSVADESLDTQLFNAIIANDIDKVKGLLNRGASVHAVSKYGNTPLHYAQSREIATELLEKGADVNRRNGLGQTPLYRAASNDRLEIAKFLVGNGANVNDGSRSGYTSLHEAAYHGHLEIVEYLLEKGGDVNAKTSFNSTPLHLAISSGNPQLVEKLIAYDADVDAIDKNGRTALDIAKASKKTEILLAISNLSDNPEEELIADNPEAVLKKAQSDFAKSVKGNKTTYCMYMGKGAKITSDSCGRKSICNSEAVCHFSIGFGGIANYRNQYFEKVFCMADANGSCPKKAIDCVLDKKVMGNEEPEGLLEGFLGSIKSKFMDKSSLKNPDIDRREKRLQQSQGVR